MQKKLIIMLVIVLLLGGGTALFFLNQNKMPAGNNAVTSMKDALTQSSGMECNYTDEKGQKVITYTKNGNFRSDYSDPKTGSSGSIIVVEKKIYTWSGKEGYLINAPEVTPEQGDPQTQPPDSEKFKADLEKYKQYCKSAAVADSLFIAPSDVDFQEISQKIQQ